MLTVQVDQQQCQDSKGYNNAENIEGPTWLIEPVAGQCPGRAVRTGFFVKVNTMREGTCLSQLATKDLIGKPLKPAHQLNRPRNLPRRGSMDLEPGS